MSAIDITNVTPFLLSLPAAGIGVIILAQLIKKLFGMNSDKAIHLMVVLVSAAATLASYVLQYKNLPPYVLGMSGPAIYGFSQGLYKTAKVLGDLLPRVSVALGKPVNATASASDAAVAAAAALAAHADVTQAPAPAEPAATNNNEFNG